MYKKFALTLASIMSLAAAAQAQAPAAPAAHRAPAICENLANYAAQVYGQEFTEPGGMYDNPHNPKSLVLKSDFKNYPIGSVEDLGNCDETPNLKPEWCSGFGGGEFEIYKIHMNQLEQTTSYPLVDVIVNYNSRGACIVREVQTPPQQQ